MSGQIDPISNPQAWDAVIIAGITYPYCTVSGFERTADFDIKKGKGAQGATETFTGTPPAEGEVKFILSQPSDFVLADQIRAALFYDPTKGSGQAVDFYHPATADISISAVVAKAIGIIVHEGKQLYSWTVKLLEYAPAKNTSAVSTPNGATEQLPTDPAKQFPPSASSANDKEIAALLKQASAP